MSLILEKKFIALGVGIILAVINLVQSLGGLFCGYLIGMEGAGYIYLSVFLLVAGLLFTGLGFLLYYKDI